MSVLATIAGTWLWQRLTGVGAQALAVSIAATAVVALVAGGLWWLRHDARMDERMARDAHWESRLANQRFQALAAQQARQRRSEEIAGQQAQAYATEIEHARSRAVELEQQLAKRPRTLAYPKDIIPRLNQ
jgi:hypothetical protein